MDITLPTANLKLFFVSTKFILKFFLCNKNIVITFKYIMYMYCTFHIKIFFYKKINY